MKIVLTFIFALFFSASVSTAADLEVIDPSAKDTCPVCGMFVAKYPEWVATVQYKDRHAHHFDGAKDMFKYLQDLPKWAPKHNAADMQTIAVTEYYSLGRIKAADAWYVIGSEVLGPMGHELIPMETEEDAKEFMADHKGKAILRFADVTPALIVDLDKGEFSSR